MSETVYQFPKVGSGRLEPDPRIYPEELGLALRNHQMPLEGLRYDVTPVGMHYTLIHYDVPDTSADRWTVSLAGAVRRPLTLTLPDLQSRPAVTLRVTLQCAGDGRALLSPRPLSQPWQYGAIGTAEWTGTPLRPLLEEAGLRDDALEVVFRGADRGIEGLQEQDYTRGFPVEEALRDGVILAWAMNGRPLEPQHGAPLRLVCPGWYGMAHVKWLRAIEVVTRPFQGYQNALAYRYSQDHDDPGEPVTLMRVRSMMEPPGIPDFFTRTRVLRRGPVELRGRAWSGRQAIIRVEVSTDGGTTWGDATIEPPGPHPHAWQQWRYTWQAETPGTFELVCRATDAAGETQPIETWWNARGMGNNQAHRVRVQVV